MNLSEIIHGCREFHPASQKKLYGLFYNYSMTIARRFMGSVEMAEEVTNDAFLKVFNKIHTYDEKQPFRPWLRKIVVHTAIDHLRSGFVFSNETELQPWHDEQIVLGVEEDLTREQIWAMLDALPPAYRAVFNLAVVDGFSHEEIAQTLNISVGASKSNLSRARQHLKTILKTELDLF